MRFRRTSFISLACTAVLWCVFAWPLPRHFFTGIPASAHRTPANVDPTVAGDHLQFEYYCWLASDMLAGQTRPFYNLYEFNTGDDRTRFQPDPYYFPFSLCYAIGRALGGRPFAWNLTGLLSLWLTHLFAWRLIRRYTTDEWIAALSALIAIALPFRWINLCGGSPAGFALAWIPLLWLGLDRALRDGSPAGGWMAGLAVLFACWTDSHVFFFGVLSIPAWALIAWIRREPAFRWTAKEDYVGLLKALAPLVVLTGLALLFPSLLKWIYRFATGLPWTEALVAKRELREVMLFSPHWKDLFAWYGATSFENAYVGWWLPVLLAGGGWCLLRATYRDGWRAWRPLLLYALLGGGLALVLVLALGPRAPLRFHLHLPYLWLREWIPPYALVRQPSKIFCLLPPLLAIATALALTAITASLRHNGRRRLAVAACVLLIVGLYARRVHPTISLLDAQQGAYAAVAEDAAAQAVAPRALVLPLWPGDSHQTSLYQYYATLYRIRMVNGYTPFVKADYKERVFFPLESVNQGEIAAAQFEHLKTMGVNYLLLHENEFPEKVSPFPVAFTLGHLLNHPRLRLLRQDGSVWAFKLLPTPEAKTDPPTPWNYPGAARRFEIEACRPQAATTTADAAAGGGRYLILDRPNARAITPIVRVGAAPDLRWWLRLRGDGALTAELQTDAHETERIPLTIQSADWTWLAVPLPTNGPYVTRALALEWQAGRVDADIVLLAAGQWQTPEIGRTLSMPAPCFFHAGYTDTARQRVVLRKDRDPKTLVFYGPKLPLEKGRYRVQMIAHGAAPADTLLGQFNIRRQPQDPIQWTEVRAGRPAVTEFEQPENLPFQLEFLYLGQADMEIERVDFTRVQ